MDILKLACDELNASQKALADHKRTVFEAIQKTDINLDDRTITDLIIAQMSAWWAEMDGTNKLLDRSKNPQVAEYFNETVCLYTKALIEKLQPEWHITAEKSIVRSKKPISPDISIWRGKNEGSELIAVIELKVSDGFKGATLLNHLFARENQIKQHYANSKFYSVCFWRPKVYLNEFEGLGEKHIYLIDPDSKWRADFHKASQYRIESVLSSILQS